ncbi:MAG TPA: GtrA family protein [Blastococcus sp.]
MPCASLLRRWPAATDAVDDLPSEPLRPVAAPDHVPSPRVHALAEQLRTDDILAQFIRFVLVGGSSTAVYATVFLSLQWMGYLPANIVGTVVSSVLANEMHRRLTFHADERVGWLTAQLEAGGVSLFGLVATSVALGWLDASVGSAHAGLQITLVAAVTGFIGLIRFVALRWIFRPAGAPAAQ